MTFEGEHKIIPVKGIARAGADTLCEDGAMNEVIGLEYKDGSYVPYSGKITNPSTLPMHEDIQEIYVHKTSSGDNVILKIGGLLFWDEKADFDKGFEKDFGNFDEIVTDGEVKDVEFVGNVICVSTENSVVNYIFQDGKYEKWQIDKNLLPNISFRVDLGLAGYENTIGIISYAENGNVEEEEYIKTARSTLIAAIGKAREYGGLSGYFLVCSAYRLKTGEYIKASNPVLMCRPLHKAGDKIYNCVNDNTSFSFSDSDGNTENISFIIGDLNCVVIPTIYPDGEDFDFLRKSRSAVKPSPDAYLIAKHNGVTYDSYDAFFPVMSCSIAIPKEEDHQIVHYAAPVPTNKLQFSIKKDISKEYEDMIDCLCIFISQEIDPYVDFLDDNALVDNLHISNKLSKSPVGERRMIHAVLKKMDEINNELKRINNLYLVHEISFNDIKKSDEWVDVDLKGKLGDALATRETLPISAFDCSVFSDSSLASYNSRLHMYNYKQSNEIYLNIEDFNLQGGFGQFSAELFKEYDYAYVIVDIEDSNGKSRIVKRYEKPILSGIGDGMTVMNPYIAFTHPNAKRITMICTFHDKYTYNVLMSYELNKSKHGGFTYNINKELSPNVADEYIDNLDDINNYITPYNNRVYRNGIRVSETYDVNSFPYANTYVVGKGDIIGIASLSIALSQDTFGSYPLLVFTTEGIYSLETDKTGSSAYTNIPPPFSREVCINKNTICEIDGAVLFASSKGLMIASAQGVQEFLPALNGTPKHVPTTDKSKGLGLDLYYKIINNPLSTELYDSISHDDFIQFLSNPDTVVSYVSNKNKVIVYNKSHMYSYWIDIPTRIVTKLPISIAFDNNNYPTEQYVMSSGELFEFGYLSRDTDVQCLLQSRPIKNTYGMKSNLRVIARGYFNSSDANNYAVMLVLGSYDAINWQPIGVCQRPFAGGFNDLGCVTDRVSHKYVMVIITGKMSPDSHIDGIEMTINNKYNNKLK